MTMTVLWLIVVAVMLVIEIFTMGLTTIWFSIGAVAAAVASGFSAPVWLQIVLFAAVSVLVMLLVRPFAMKVMDCSVFQICTDWKKRHFHHKGTH